MPNAAKAASAPSTRLRTSVPRPTSVCVRPPKQLQSGADPRTSARTMTTQKTSSRASAASAAHRASAGTNSAPAMASSTSGRAMATGACSGSGAPKSATARRVPLAVDQLGCAGDDEDGCENELGQRNGDRHVLLHKR